MTTWTLRLRARPRWHLDDAGNVVLHDPSRGTEVRMRAWAARVLEGLERGTGPAAIETAALTATPTPTLGGIRRFLLALEEVGILAIEIPLPATILGWRVHRELGRGGVGIAYLVERDGTRAVAKVPWDFGHPIDVARDAIRREADVLAKLDHPAIARPLAPIDDAILIREHVDGPSLPERFEGRPATHADARAIAIAIADAIAHIEARGLVLVDYKPGNVFLPPEGGIKLIDVGHAREPGATRVGGTPGFLPPEIAAGAPLTPRADVWGIGRLYAYMRRGRLYGIGARSEGALDGLPDDARALVADLCADDPTARPADAREAIARLRTG